MLQEIRAMVRKDMTITWRNPSLLLLSIIVPVVFVLIYSLITQVSATNPVVIARESQGPYSQKLISILTEMRSVDGPYFTVNTTDPREAKDRYERGDAAAMIVIPADFDTELGAGAPGRSRPKVELHVHNLNSDATKNFQLRLDHAAYLFQQENAPLSLIHVNEAYSRFPRDVSMKLYVSLGLLMFTAVYASMVNTGLLISREWEERTSKEAILTPAGFLPLVIGKWATALVQTMASVLLVLGIMGATLDFPIHRMDPALWFWIFILFLFGGSLGAALGVWLRKSMPLITFSAVTGIFLYLVCGNESSLRGFAYGGPVEVLWRMADMIPVSQAVEHMRRTFLESGSGYAFDGLLPLLILSALFAWLSGYRLKKRLSYSQGQ